MKLALDTVSHNVYFAT